MLESLFTFLFKYPSLVFEQGTFVFWATRSMWLVAAVAAGGAWPRARYRLVVSHTRNTSADGATSTRVRMTLSEASWRSRSYVATQSSSTTT